MKERWTSDKCYGEWGVDGSECSIVKYLSEVESWCPKLASFQKSNSNKKNNTIKVPVSKRPILMTCLYARSRVSFQSFSSYTSQKKLL